MAAVWEEVLQIANVGMNDNFFRIGGHSIMAVKLLNKIKDAFNTEISLKDLFQKPVFKELCSFIKCKADYNNRGLKTDLITIEPDIGQGSQPFQLTDIQRAYLIGRDSSFGLGNVATHIYQEFDIIGLDINRFNNALIKLIERHDMLRAVILPEGKQVVLENVPDYKIRVTDITGYDKEEAEAVLFQIRNEMSHQVKKTDQWPLFDIRASKSDNGLVKLHVSFDLLIADAWSFRILFNEISILYENPEKELPVLNISFRDYIKALNRLEETEIFQKARDYWIKRLDIIPKGPILPLANEPSSISKPGFKRLRHMLPAREWGILKSQAGKFDITPNGLLLAVFSEILRRWSKEPSFTLNVTIFNRLPLHPQINDIIGDFTSIILLAVDGQKSGCFKDRARDIQQTLWSDMDNRYFCGIRVMNQLIQQGYAREVIPIVFTSLLGFEDVSYEKSIFKRLDSSSQDFGISQTPQIWLDHQVSEYEGALEFNWDFVEDIFPQGMVEDMFDTYCSFINRLISEDAWTQTSSVELYNPRLRNILCRHSEKQPTTQELLHTLFRKQAKRKPYNRAVIAFDRELTYGELDKASDWVAYCINNKYFQTKSIVAVIMEKGWEQIAAVLGVLKSGSAYLPIDPDLPDERIKYLLEKADVRLALVREKKTISRLAGFSDIPSLALDSKAFEWDGNYEMPPGQNPSDLAYVIFTSGSTGTPKGVMIAHNGAVNTIVDINSRFNIGENDKVLALSSLSFDLSVYDIFGILAAGGAIVIPEARKLRDPEYWSMLLKEHGITVWNSVPAFMKMLVCSGVKGLKQSISNLRLVLLSGDWIPLNLPDAIRSISPQTRIISLGGATEASIWSIYYNIDQVDSTWKSIPYGWSLANQSVYVMDKNLELCPVWVIGELYIGGIGVALGYLNDKEKTEYSFVTRPNTGERIYRTGDLGRYRPDGSIEFLGREDTQVKIQGFRIELGEIETAIKDSPLVKDAIVSVTGKKYDDKKLVAYIIPDYDNIGSNNKNEYADDIINDPSRRLEFKMREPAVRKDLIGNYIALDGAGPIMEESYINRRSYRKFSGTEISYNDFCGFIGCLSQINLKGIPFPKYLYASSGGLYPIQTYIYIKEKSIYGIKGGIYYFNPKMRALIEISRASINKAVHVPENQPIFEESAFSIFLVARMDAIEPMYGKQRSERYCLLEAGSMAHLLEMYSFEYNIGLCQIGVLDFDLIRSLFMLDESCVYLHSMVGGGISKQQQTVEGLMEEWRQYQWRKEEYKNRNSFNFYVDLLREQLIERLPYYMIPSGFQVVKEFPLTPNGKIDRKALNSLGDKTPEQTDNQSIPQNGSYERSYIESFDNSSIEKILISIWMKVLNKDRIDIYDNFFDLGGDSLLITQVHRELEEALGMGIQIVDLFKYPTVSSLLKYLSDRSASEDGRDSFNRAEIRLSQRRARHRGGLS